MNFDRLRRIRLSHILKCAVWLVRLFSIAEDPFALFWHYLKATSPSQIRLRTGHRLYCSDHPHDLITFFVIFIKRDYGKISPNSVVVDVGANIGLFSL